MSTWKQLNTAMVGYWLPTFLTIFSVTLVLGVGIFVDKLFFLFAIPFVPLLILMWASVWSWEHPHIRYGQMGLPLDED